MALNFSINLRAAVGVRLANTLGVTGIGVASYAHTFTLAQAILSTGNEDTNASALFYMPPTTLLNGATQIIDVYDYEGIDGGAGDGRDPLGQPLAIEELVAFQLRKTGSGVLRIEPDPDFAGWTPIGTHVLSTGEQHIGLFYPADGIDVIDGISHRIKLTASSDDVTYTFIAVGRTVDDDESSSSSSTSTGSSSSTLSSASSTSSISISSVSPGESPAL